MGVFPSRFGQRFRWLVSVPITQVVLPQCVRSRVVDVSDVLDGVEGVAVCRLTSADVVRHPLVQRVVEAYARLDDQRSSRPVRR